MIERIGRRAVIAVLTVATAVPAVPAGAADQPLPGLKLVLKSVAGREKLVWVSKTPSVVAPMPGGPDDPRTVGATLDIANPASGESATFDLPPAQWRVNSAGTVFKFVNTAAPSPPSEVKVAVIKHARLVKVVAKATGITLDEATQGTLRVMLTAGSERYCAQFGSALRDEPGKFIARNAPAPGSCGGGGPTTTTSTSSTTLAPGSTTSTTATTTTATGPTTTSTSSTTLAPGSTTSTTATTTTAPGPTTTTTTIPACDCCTKTKLAFTTTVGSGNCGVVRNSAGTVLTNLTCGGLYFGGGLDSVPLPVTVPDQAESVTNIMGCSSVSGAFTLGPSTAAETGSIRNCTKAGCLFGPPLPIPNSSSTPTSTCVINTVALDAAGSGTCNGASSVNLPLSAGVFLAGDILPFEPGIQPCPICTGPSGSETCQGGPNDGDPCTPAGSDLGDAFPTSHDCPPTTTLHVGDLAIGFGLTTGTSSRTAQNTGAQPRVFCGYCRDADATLGHGVCAGGLNAGFTCSQQTDCPGGTCGGEIPCSTDADCSDPREGCAQRNSGAFAFATARTITATGSPAGTCLDDGLPHAATLVSVFCVPPSFDGTVDSAADLPGPGAVALPGMMQLSP